VVFKNTPHYIANENALFMHQIQIFFMILKSLWNLRDIVD